MKAIKTLPHATRGWWGAEGEGIDKVLYVKDVDLEVTTPIIELEMEDIIIELEVTIEETELEE